MALFALIATMSSTKIYYNARDLYFELGNFTLENEEVGIYFLSSNTVMLAHAFIQHYGRWRNRYTYDLSKVDKPKLSNEDFDKVSEIVDLAIEELMTDATVYLARIAKSLEEIEFTHKDVLAQLRGDKTVKWFIDKPDEPSQLVANPFITVADDSLLNCLCNEAETEQLKRIANSVSNMQKELETSNQCLLATQKAINDALGGPSVEGCDDSSVPADCQPTAQTWDGLVYVADEMVSIVETFGSYLATPIVNFLIGARWFTRALLAVGLAEPSPTEELVTVPLAGVVEAITYFVEKSIDIGTSTARAAINELKANRNGDVDKLCRADESTIDETIDEIVDTVKDVFNDPQIQQNVKSLLDGFFKAPPVKGVILTK